MHNHIIFRNNYNIRWDRENGSLLCNYNHNQAPNAPHHDNEKFIEWFKIHRPLGLYQKLLNKSGEKGGANKLEILELMQLRNQLKYIKGSLEKTKKNSEQLAFTRG